MANYFRNENFKKLKINENLLSLYSNIWYKKILCKLIINILIFRIFLLLFSPRFFVLPKFQNSRFENN